MSTRATRIFIVCAVMFAPGFWAAASAQILDGNDEIELIVPNYSELSGKYVLNTQGELSMRIMSPISLTGMGVLEAERVIADSLSRYLQSVAGLKIASVQEWNEITVIGYVNKPGTIRLPDQATLADALVAAGGAIQGALLNRIEVRRRSDDPSPRIVNYARFLYRGDMQLLQPLTPGSVIFVPKGLGEVNSSENLIYVFGSVRSPGIHEISGQTTLLDALAFVGGPLATADIGHMRIIPADASRPVQVVDFGAVEKRTQEIILLRPGDTLFVPEKKRSLFSTSIQLISALVLVLNSYQLLKK
jgi:protein involved in polysaccharide export with SLBB domain